MKTITLLPAIELDYGTIAKGMDLQALAAEIPSDKPHIPLTASQIEGAAWDVAVFPERQHDIMEHYGLDGAQWRHMTTLPGFLAGQKHAMQALKSDPNMASRIVARNAMASAVLVAADLARSSLVEPKDRLNAVKLLADIVQMGDTGAGAENRKASKGGGTGATITLNFGNVIGAQLKRIIAVGDDL